LTEYAIFLHGLAQRQKHSLAQR